MKAPWLSLWRDYKASRARARARRRLRRNRPRHGVWDRVRDNRLLARPEVIAIVAILTLAFIVWEHFQNGEDKPPVLGLVAKVREVQPNSRLAAVAGVPLGAPIEYHARAHNLDDAAMHDVALWLVAPSGVILASESCVAKDGSGTRVPCTVSGQSAHVEDADLAAGQVLDISVKGELRPGLDADGQPASVKVSSEEATVVSRETIIYPHASPGLAAYHGYVHREVHGRLPWHEVFPAPGTREFVSTQWHRLTPYGLHRIAAFREALHARFGQIFADESLGAKIITVRTTVSGQPLRGRRHRSRRSHELILRERVPLGGDGQREAWCSTSVRAEHPLRPGDQVVITAVIVAWGIVYPDGHRRSAVLLICPTVRVVRPAPPKLATRKGHQTAQG